MGVQLFIDGVLVSTQDAAYYPHRDEDWTLTLGNFDGDIDEVRISNIAR